jgi:hypothetical protein
MGKLCKWVEQQFNYRQQSDEVKTPPSSKGFRFGNVEVFSRRCAMKVVCNNIQIKKGDKRRRDVAGFCEENRFSIDNHLDSHDK